ncbi:tenascin-like [Adelges cooleyi]|uniref:tenascin-like n=1 Tax=Adelges cooleyi TaxID=133065 RepID=UPI00218029CC|nr:tenascin-like [Adelges cooleyi]
MNLKCVLYVFGLFLLNKTFADNYTAEHKSHSSTDYDITVVYRLRGNSTNFNKCARPDKFLIDFINDGCYGGEVHSRTNAIGLPITFNGRVLRSKDKDLEFIVDSSYPNRYFTKNHVKYDPSKWIIDSTYRKYTYTSYGHYNSYRDQKTAAGSLLKFTGSYSSSTFKISWTPKETVEGCVSITYIMSNGVNNENKKYLMIYEVGSYNPIISHQLKNTSELETLILRTKNLFFKNNTYQLVISSHSYPDNSDNFGIKRIAECNNEDGEIYEISGSEISSSPIHKANVYQLHVTESSDSAYSQKECKVNRFGADCSGICSTRHKTFCQNKLFCTSNSRCSCASGYTGKFCDENCPSGTFGRDCQHQCAKNCLSECNVFTGVCLGGCKKNFVLPNCTEKYPWLKTPPQLVSSDYRSVKLNLSFESGNIDGSQQIPLIYYQIAYKKKTSEFDFQYSDIKAIRNSYNIIDKVEHLHAGTEYTFGVKIISKDGNFNDEDMNTANYRTQCQVPKNIDYGLKCSKSSNHIEVTWEKYFVNDTYECKIIGYTVKIINNREETVEVNTKENNHIFQYLLPASEYAIQVTALTNFGSAEPSAIVYETTDVLGYIGVQNITAKLLDSNKVIHLTWELGNPYIDAPISYLIKHKINRNYSCSHSTVGTTLWTENTVHNKTEYDINLDFIPNVQYIIQVVPITTGSFSLDDENVVFVQTESSTPKLAPAIDKSHPVYVTNDTAQIKWFVDKRHCMDLNGILSGYHLTLKNRSNGTQTTIETEDTAVELTDLVPNTDYELQICIKTDKGFDMDYALSVPFKTKPKYLPPAEEITVYKKNTKTRSIDLRWSYPNDSAVDGFILQTSTNNQKSDVNQITIEPFRCKAWPKFYCTTINNMIPGVEYTVKVRAKSVDYPNGGLPASISFNTIDGSPDEPGNLKTTHVGAKSVSLEWDIPWMLNGVLRSFIINAEEVSAIDVDSCCVSLPVMELQVTEELPTYNYTIVNLRPGSTYTIGVLAKNSWYGQAKKIYVTTLLLDTTSEITTETNVFNATETS